MVSSDGKYIKNNLTDINILYSYFLYSDDIDELCAAVFYYTYTFNECHADKDFAKMLNDSDEAVYKIL